MRRGKRSSVPIVKRPRALARDALDIARRHLDFARNGESLIVTPEVLIIPRESILVKTWDMLDDLSGFRGRRWILTKHGELGKVEDIQWREPTPMGFINWAKVQPGVILRRLLDRLDIPMAADACQALLAYRLGIEYETRWRARHGQVREPERQAKADAFQGVVLTLAREGVGDDRTFHFLINAMSDGHTYTTALTQMRTRMAQAKTEKKPRSTADILNDMESESDATEEELASDVTEQNSEDDGVPDSEPAAVKAPKGRAKLKSVAKPPASASKPITHTSKKETTAVTTATKKATATKGKPAPAKSAEKSTTAPAAKGKITFKVGAKVKYVGRNADYKGRSGLIEKSVGNGAGYLVKIGNESVGPVSPNSLQGV